jgi:glycerol-3-phosphate cytidylyltransferase
MSLCIGYAPGAFDLFHVGHLNALRHARRHCDVLVAGVVGDEVCLETKGIRPVVPEQERAEILSSIRYVDVVHVERTTDRMDAWRELGFHRIFKGDDWRGTEKGRRLEERFAPLGVDVRYFPYTMHTSSTKLRARLAGLGA